MRQQNYIQWTRLTTFLVNEKLKDPRKVANAFNNFFITITEILNIQRTEKGDATLILQDSFPGNFPNTKLIPITEAEIRSIIRSLKTKKSSGYDEKTSKILRTCTSLISHPLQYIYNNPICLFLSVLKMQK
jgi:hypothetical protein